MGCGNGRHKTCHDKSCQRYYNSTSQPLAVSTTTQLAIAGVKVVDSGISIETEPMNYTTVKTGLYHFAGDVIINLTAGGVVIFRMLMDGVVLPCTVRTFTAGTGYREIHTETDLELDGCCCNVSHTFTFEIVTDAAATGTVTQFCSGITKLA